MMYESEAIKNNSLYVENNAVTAIVHAIAKKLNLDYKDIYDAKYQELVHTALQPFYQHVDRMAWRIEYLLNAIQNSTEGKNLTPEGSYLNSEFHKNLTTDGRIMAPKIKFKRDFHSLSLVNENDKVIGWANLSFSEMATLKKHLEYTLKMDLEDLEGNLKSIRKDIENGEPADEPLLEEMVEMQKNIDEWQKILNET